MGSTPATREGMLNHMANFPAPTEGIAEPAKCRQELGGGAGLLADSGAPIPRTRREAVLAVTRLR